ncbi:MAG TPA: MgtC/SapB family protein [Clostridiaceae bacterium]|nr:MgtC/SapB family protein [Clostridiaceae bacterium]
MFTIIKCGGKYMFHLEILLKLILACFLGGVIGFEREHMNRPAGFRTHIVVCVGSALIMVTSQYIFEMYADRANIDPARLGAQIISGIGFLGAGTIIRDGFNVRGLTTAASLWAVSAVGIAVGIGFYEGAIMATALIFATLILLKRIEWNISKRNRHSILYIEADNIPGQIAKISSVLDKYSIVIKKIDFVNGEEDAEMLMKLVVKLPGKLKTSTFINDLHKISGVKKAYEE